MSDVSAPAQNAGSTIPAGALGVYRDVLDFHRATDTPVRAEPSLPSPERRKLRIGLLREEFNEYLSAESAHDIVEIADALADIIYVAVGTALEYGIPLCDIWAEVQRSNMAKVDPATGKCAMRPDGKIMKPPTWTPPDVRGVIARALQSPSANIAAHGRQDSESADTNPTPEQ